MPVQTIQVPNLGQYGQLPDVAPSNLPLNAATYARNFRFHEGDFAEVSAGYSNALASRNRTELGDENTDITFLYTWILYPATMVRRFPLAPSHLMRTLRHS